MQCQCGKVCLQVANVCRTSATKVSGRGDIFCEPSNAIKHTLCQSLNVFGQLGLLAGVLLTFWVRKGSLKVNLSTKLNHCGAVFFALQESVVTYVQLPEASEASAFTSLQKWSV